MKTFKGRVKKLKEQVKAAVGVENDLYDFKSLEKWQQRHETAYANYSDNMQLYDNLELLYLGTKSVEKTGKSKGSNSPAKEATTIRNAVYELVESQVNTVIPSASVRSKQKGFDRMAQMIQEKLNSDMEELEMEFFNDHQERNTKVHGLAAICTNWDPDYSNHLYRGEKKIEKLLAKQLIPQQGIYDFNKMDFFFEMRSVTKKQIKDTFGVDVEQQEEEYPDINTLRDGSIEGIGRGSQHGSKDDSKITLIIAHYWDEDGDYGRFSWVGEDVVENKSKYYLPRVEKCKECDFESPQGSEVCDKCGSKKLDTVTLEFEEVQEDMELSPIVYNSRKWVIKTDPMTGKKSAEEVEDEVIIERILKKGEKLPIFRPKRSPIAIQINTPQNYSVAGVSDVAVIRTLYDSLKKVMTRINEKILKSGAIIAVDTDLSVKITNELYQVIKGTAAQIQGIKVNELKATITEDIAYARELYENMKSTLGITDSFQGKYDPSAKSGKAKEAQIQQASGRLASKLVNKYKFYADLFNIWFDYDMAFTNEVRPYMRKDNKGKMDIGEFNKYELLLKDSNDEWYYNTEFIITSDTADVLPDDKAFIYEQTQAQFSAGLLQLEQYWMIMERLGYPLAKTILDQITEQETKEDPIALFLEMLNGLSPEEKIAFIEQPLEIQLQAVQQAMMPEQEGEVQNEVSNMQ